MSLKYPEGLIPENEPEMRRLAEMPYKDYEVLPSDAKNGFMRMIAAYHLPQEVYEYLEVQIEDGCIRLYPKGPVPTWLVQCFQVVEAELLRVRAQIGFVGSDPDVKRGVGGFPKPLDEKAALCKARKLSPLGSSEEIALLVRKLLEEDKNRQAERRLVQAQLDSVRETLSACKRDEN